MHVSFRRQLLLVAAGVTLFAGLTHLNVVGAFLQGLAALLLPIFSGLGLAFVLNVPMHGFEMLLRRLCARKKKHPTDAGLQRASFVLTLAALCLVTVVVFTVVLPQLGQSFRSLYHLVESKSPAWIQWLKDRGIRTDRITGWLEGLDLGSMLNRLTIGAGALLNSVASAASSAFSAVSTVVMALVVAVYVLLSKRELSRQSRKLLYACCSREAADWVCRVAEMLRSAYARFLSGQCIEAVILGLLIFAAFSLFRLPYAGVIGVLTGAFAFVPYVGAFAACLLGALLTLLAAPAKVLLCIVVYQIVQFIENQFIYPRVVGGSVGLSPLWTLVAALIGGRLLGLFGMIFFIPLVAVVYELVREAVNRRLQEKRLRIE